VSALPAAPRRQVRRPRPPLQLHVHEIGDPGECAAQLAHADALVDALVAENAELADQLAVLRARHARLLAAQRCTPPDAARR